MRVKGEIVYRLMLKSQSFSDPVTMGCDLHKRVSVFSLGGKGIPESLKLDIFLSPGWVVSDKSPVGYTLIK